MKSKLLFGSLLSGLLFIAAGKSVQYEKNNFYTALSSDKLEVINTHLDELKASSLSEKEAYEGALLMKKAGLITGSPSDKLSLFKSGKSKLETAIGKNKTNVEYRFLRLIIQEHAPKIVKYRDDLEGDSELVRTNFKTLPDFVQKFILDYNRTSKVLKIVE